MSTTYVILCAIALMHSAVEARYVLAAGGYNGGGANAVLGAAGGYGGGENAVASESYGNEADTYNLGGGSVMRLALPNFEQSGPSYHQSGGSPVSAAVQTKRTVEVKPVRMPEDHAEPHIVDVEASVQPVHVIFRSASNPVMVQQIHKPAEPNKVERTQSEDEPHRVQHQVTRPVIQEVREIIQPYRRVLQEIRPVLEEVRTVVAKASDGPGQGAVGDNDNAERGGGYGGRNNERGNDINYGSRNMERANDISYASRSNERANDISYASRSNERANDISYASRSNERANDNNYRGAPSSITYSDSMPSLSVVPSPSKYARSLRKSHSRRIASAKRYSKRV